LTVHFQWSIFSDNFNEKWLLYNQLTAVIYKII
jgi:hypothetical protein